MSLEKTIGLLFSNNRKTIDVTLLGNPLPPSASHVLFEWPLSQKGPTITVRYNGDFIISEFVITEFYCITFHWFLKTKTFENLHKNISTIIKGSLHIYITLYIAY